MNGPTSTWPTCFAQRATALSKPNLSHLVEPQKVIQAIRNCRMAEARGNCWPAAHDKTAGSKILNRTFSGGGSPASGPKERRLDTRMRIETSAAAAAAAQSRPSNNNKWHRRIGAYDHLGTGRFEAVIVKREVGSTQGYDLQAIAVARMFKTEPAVVVQDGNGKWHALDHCAVRLDAGGRHSRVDGKDSRRSCAT